MLGGLAHAFRAELRARHRWRATRTRRRAWKLQCMVSGPSSCGRLKENVLADLPEKLESIVYDPEERAAWMSIRRMSSSCDERLTRRKRLQGGKCQEPSLRRLQMRATAATAAAAGDDFKKQEAPGAGRAHQAAPALLRSPPVLYEDYKGGSCQAADHLPGAGAQSTLDAGRPQVLVFSQFTSMLDADLRASCAPRKIASSTCISGSTSKEQPRCIWWTRFQARTTCAGVPHLAQGRRRWA